LIAQYVWQGPLSLGRLHISTHKSIIKVKNYLERIEMLPFSLVEFL
jgi:hypothetical protein